jgi:hypothetical protein
MKIFASSSDKRPQEATLQKIAQVPADSVEAIFEVPENRVILPANIIRS